MVRPRRLSMKAVTLDAVSMAVRIEVLDLSLYMQLGCLYDSIEDANGMERCGAWTSGSRAYCLDAVVKKKQDRALKQATSDDERNQSSTPDHSYL